MPASTWCSPLLTPTRSPARLYVSLFATSPLTRHDGPLSVRRAYTPDEAEAMARTAGWNAPVAVALPFFRMMLHDGL